MKLKWMRDDEPLRVDWPVTIEAPADGGGLDSETVTLRFEIVPAAEAEALLAPEAGDLARSVMAGVDPDTTVRFLTRVIVGWSEVEVGASFSPEALGRLLRFPFARNAIFRAYGQAAQGRRAKN
jgi:hypothetical protein